MNYLVTGTSRGIGKYLAEYYSGKEGNIVFGCSRSESDIKNSNYVHFKVNLSERDEIRLLFSEIRKKYGRLDVLINNAAINITPSPFMLIPSEKFKEVFDINFFGAVYSCRESIKIMSTNKFGRIINISSMAVKHEVSGESVYTSAKAALNSFTRVISKEVYNLGITCNVVAPSAIETDLLQNIDKDVLNTVLERNAIKEFGKMADITNTIDWLIQPQSDAVTGQIIYLGGV